MQYMSCETSTHKRQLYESGQSLSQIARLTTKCPLSRAGMTSVETAERTLLT